MINQPILGNEIMTTSIEMLQAKIDEIDKSVAPKTKRLNELEAILENGKDNVDRSEGSYNHTAYMLKKEIMKQNVERNDLAEIMRKVAQEIAVYSSEGMIDNFLAINNWHSQPDLARAIVKQLGGEQNFIKTYEDISCNGTDNNSYGNTYEDDLLSFFEENKEALISVAMSLGGRTGDPSAVGFIHNYFRKLDTNLLNVTLDDIASVLYSGKLNNDEDRVIAEWLVRAVIKDLARCFSNSMTSCPKPNLFISK